MRKAAYRGGCRACQNLCERAIRHAAAPEPKRFVHIEGEGHTRDLEQGGMMAVNDFLAAIEARLPDHSSDITYP